MLEDLDASKSKAVAIPKSGSLVKLTFAVELPKARKQPDPLCAMIFFAKIGLPLISSLGINPWMFGRQTFLVDLTQFVSMCLITSVMF